MADFDITEIANAKTEAEADAAIKKFNEKLQQKESEKKKKKIPLVKTMDLSGRLALLDELRGLCLLAMMAYHLFYIMGFMFGMERGAALHGAMRPFAPIPAAFFVIIAGFCVCYSKDLSRRGLKLLIYALCISLGTIVILPMFGIDDMAVWFGILHLLAVAKLLMALWQKFFGKVPWFIGLPLSLLLFQYTSSVSARYFSLFGHFTLTLPDFLYNTNWLLPLGFHTPGFTTWDYFPLLPFLFLFMFGVFLGRPMKDSLPKFCYRSTFLPLAWLGRHSLGIYLAHMFILYGVVHFFYTVFS